MAINYLSPINLNQLELQNAVVQNLASAPSNPVEGQIYMNTTTDKLMYYDGSEWIALDAKPAAGTQAQLNAGTNTDNKIWCPKVIHDFVGQVVSSANAMRFRGTLGTGGTIQSLPTTDVKVGDTYMVVTAGTYSGHVCEVGDLIIAIETTPTWTVAQTNLDGAITSITAGTGIDVTGSGSSRTIGLESGVITAGSKGETQNKSPGFAGTFKVLQATVDTYGRVTGLEERTITIPSSGASATSPGLMSSALFNKLSALPSPRSTTLQAGQTSVTESDLTLLYGYNAYDATTGESVVLDCTIGSNSITWSIASAITHDIIIKHLSR